MMSKSLKLRAPLLLNHVKIFFIPARLVALLLNERKYIFNKNQSKVLRMRSNYSILLGYFHFNFLKEVFDKVLPIIKVFI